MAEVAVENQFLEQQKRISESQRKSATSGWTESHRRLVNMLSMPADGHYPRKVPAWTKFAKSFFRDKSIQTALNIMTQATKRSWPGSMLRSGMVTLVAQGFVAPEQRRERMGFSVFHFAPPNHKEETTQKEKEQQIRDGHSSGDLNEDLVKEYARQKYFLPFRLDEAQNMLEVCIKVLELLCGPATIALLPYQKGLEILYSRHHDIYWAIEQDKHYLVKFLFFLDGVFQNLVQTLLRCLEFPSPTTQAAARQVHMLPGRQIEDIMRDFLTNNIQVNLPVPTALVSKLGTQSVDGGRMITMGSTSKKTTTTTTTTTTGDSETKKPKKNTREEKKPEKWHRENPSPVAAWEFPEDVPTMTFFPKEGRFNNKFPKFEHHITNRSAPMCLKYQTCGECYKGEHCTLAHVVPDKMPSSKRAKVDEVMAEQKRIAIEKKLME